MYYQTEMVRTLQSSRKVPPLSSVQVACETYDNLVIPVRNTIRYNRNARLTRKRNLHCTCVRNPATTSRKYSLGPASAYYHSTPGHSISCPCYGNSKNSAKLGLQFTSCNRILSCIVDACLVWTGRSIGANLTHLTVVSRKHPSFVLIDYFVKFAHWAHWAQEFSNYTVETPERIKAGLDLFLQAYRQLLASQRASPLDTLPDGRNMLHVSSQCCGLAYFAEYLGLSPIRTPYHIPGTPTFRKRCLDAERAWRTQ
jgi:hypothetical protein